ncbi:Hypothetical protein CINCED_3A003944 [Cinara cedri]|uniref:Uncharacterized protein n=1 Tax=Cinara cedri TaxID=506608 RepID=A0A5E4M6M3_9HEMI|nr:Hypothetical protein CINCED_3A003944 [Cinara cedri]
MHGLLVIRKVSHIACTIYERCSCSPHEETRPSYGDFVFNLPLYSPLSMTPQPDDLMQPAVEQQLN